MRFNFQISWFAFSIFSYWPFKIVESERLPRSVDEVEAIFNCLAKVIGYDIIPESYGTKISAGEYIEEFCKDIRTINVQEKMKKYVQKNQKISEKVKNCLHNSDNDDIYQDYYDFGNSEFNALHNLNDNMMLDAVPRTSIKDNQFQTSQHLQSEDQEHAISEDEVNENDILNISKFVLGACLKDKPLDFNELTIQDEKDDTITCLENCISTFIIRITDVISRGRSKIINDLEKKGIIRDARLVEEIDKNEFPNEMKYIEDESKTTPMTHTFGYAFYSSSSLDLETMTNAGKISLNHYSQAYSNINEYLSKTETNNEPTMAAQVGEKTSINNKQDVHLDRSVAPKKLPNTLLSNIDTKLSRLFMYCKYCAKRECFMKKTSLPLYAYVYDLANGVDPTAVSTTVEDDRKIAETSIQRNVDISSTVQTKIQPKRKFFEVLINLDKYENDADDKQ